MKKLIFSFVFVLLLFSLSCSKEESRWSKPISGKTFKEAAIYCSNLKEDGISGWRLPTSAELSRFDEDEGYYWTSDDSTDLNKNKEYSGDEDKAWFYDFSKKKKIKSFDSTRMRVVCYLNEASIPEQPTPAVSQKDKNACEFARENSHDNVDIWNRYLKEFPHGSCIKEAKEAISKYNGLKDKAKEKELYEKAKKRDTRAAWENYLRKFPKGEYSLEANFKKDNLKKEKIDKLEWSDRSPNEMNWNNALNYCKTLKENGNKKWRLPNIDELRTLIKKRETATGGDCKVSEKSKCLEGEGSGCWTWETCAEACSNHSWSNCRRYDDGRYSKLGDDTIWLWSSSTPSKDSAYAWGVYFMDGHIGFYSKKGSIYVRCVR